MWHSYRGAEARALERAVEILEREDGSVDVQVLALPNDQINQKLVAAVPRNNGPDLVIFGHDRIGDWAQSRIIAPFPEPPARGVYLEPTIEPLRRGGDLYGLPLAFKSLVLYFNPLLVRAAPRTTDDLIATARRATRRDRGVFGLVYESQVVYHTVPWITGFGGALFGRDGPRLATAENARAFAFARRLGVEEGVMPADPTSALVGDLFNRGKAAMVVNGPWFLGDLRDGTPYRLGTLPVVSDTRLPARPFLTVEAIMLTTCARDPASAARVARALTQGQSAIVRALQGLQPVAWSAAWNDPRVAGHHALSVFRRQLDATVAMPNDPRMASVWEPAARALRKVMRGDAEPIAALGTADRQIATVLAPPPRPRSTVPYLVGLGLAFALLALGIVRRARRIGAVPKARAARHAYAYLAPAVLAVAVLIALPFVVGASMSLFWHRGGEFRFVGFDNFVRILLSQDQGIGDPGSFYFTLAVTMAWTTANVALHVAIGLGLALLLRPAWLRLRGVYRTLLILPWAVPSYITALVWKGMFHRQFGAINAVLEAVGARPVSFFGRFWTAFAANLTTNTWLGFPFMMVVTLGALQAIPRDLEDAAAVDGASAWQRFRHVTLPLVKPALVPAVLLGSVWTFNMFNVIYLVSGGEPDGQTEILISEAYRWAFDRQSQYGYAAAYAVLIFAVLILYSRATRRLKEAEP
ncbi:MAG: extracellular solute-binding protein [Deltaproteobacteria bacterium]|nr:extracellular solute-binding protein [Deltaproteobacteria bacterium]